MKFLKSSTYYLLFTFYLLVVGYLSSSSELVFEWKFLFDDYDANGGGYSIFGMPTAYMPPLYFWYLLAFRAVFSVESWIMLSCVAQAALYYWAVLMLVKEFESKFSMKGGRILPLLCLLFFPPILLPIAKVSSFALTTIAIVFFFSLVIRLYHKVRLKDVIFLIIVCAAGLYLRYEFLFLMLLTAVALVLAKRFKWWIIPSVAVLVFVLYLPWCCRNYQEIGMFHYSSSLSYNFAKGNHIKYDLLSSSNSPYDPKTNEFLDEETLHKKFSSEKEINNYLEELNKNFLKEHPEMFVTNSFKKLGITFFNYFPYNYNLGPGAISWIYSVVMTLFNFTFIAVIYSNFKRENNFWALFWVGLFIFYLGFYSVAPLPRYYLFYFPIFFLVVYKYTVGRVLDKK